MSTTPPIDLPVTKQESTYSEENQLTAIIFENNMYGFEDDETRYTFEEYKEALSEKIEASTFKVQKIKIDGHRLAHYESVFNVLAFCQANDLNPVLAYDK
ncbi:MAG: biopolymer transporter ExbD [Crocinitomicaceae bacterium]|nr:biopolymer transporter ExbD [Crocinitomicaceae bacterium]